MTKYWPRKLCTGEYVWLPVAPERPLWIPEPPVEIEIPGDPSTPVFPPAVM